MNKVEEKLTNIELAILSIEKRLGVLESVEIVDNKIERSELTEAVLKSLSYFELVVIADQYKLDPDHPDIINQIMKRERKVNKRARVL